MSIVAKTKVIRLQSFPRMWDPYKMVGSVAMKSSERHDSTMYSFLSVAAFISMAVKADIISAMVGLTIITAFAIITVVLYRRRVRAEAGLMDSPSDAMGFYPSPGSSQTQTYRSDLAAHMERNQKYLTFRSKAFFIPHPDKAESGGEDAYFMTDEALAVFDGVGAFRANGTGDSGIYARNLSHETKEQVRRKGPLRITNALETAQSIVPAVGSSTAVVLGMSKDGAVAGVSVGDSKMMVVHNGRAVFESTPRQHSFNRPLQLGKWSADTVFNGEFIDLRFTAGDCVVLATDGLWDNVYGEAVLEVVQAHMQKHHVPSEQWDSITADTVAAGIAFDLIQHGLRGAGDPEWCSPFTRCASEHGRTHAGGKVDDITVVVAFVVDQREELWEDASQ